MSETETGRVVRLEAAQEALRDHFLGWQCRLRQLAVREAGGRPTSGMRPELRLDAEGPPLGAITTLILRREPAEATAQFRHMVRKTQDPAERHDAALKMLAAAYYQRPEVFSDRLTALFGPGSDIAGRVLAAGRCRLAFEQYSQRYTLPCAVRALTEDDPAYQATYWHNALFNAGLPGTVRVLGFQPDWALALADPPVARP
jgi:hypothetical protein